MDGDKIRFTLLTDNLLKQFKSRYQAKLIVCPDLDPNYLKLTSIDKLFGHAYAQLLSENLEHT